MATIVRVSHQDSTTGAIESGRQSATERTRQDVQERLLTAMDRRSVWDPTRHPRTRLDVQSRRI